MFKSLKKIYILSILTFLAACGTVNIQSVRDDDIHGITEEYKLGGGDVLSVKVFGDEALTGEYKINQNGELFLPLIGNIDVVNKSLKQVKSALEKTLGETYLNDPDVHLDVTEYRPVYVLGEVRLPGKFEYIPGMNLAHAVALARGFTPRGDQEYVKVYRDNQQEGVAYRFKPDIYVLPGDTIIIEPRFF